MFYAWQKQYTIILAWLNGVIGTVYFLLWEIGFRCFALCSWALHTVLYLLCCGVERKVFCYLVPLPCGACTCRLKTYFYFTVIQVMRNTSHVSHVSTASTPLVSLIKEPILDIHIFIISLEPCVFGLYWLAKWTVSFLKTTSVPTSNLLLVPPTRSVRWLLSCLNLSCCHSHRISDQTHTKLPTVRMVW